MANVEKFNFENFFWKKQDLKRPLKLSETHYKINILHETKVVKKLMHSFFKSIKVQESEAPGRYVSNYIHK